jgi:hypothetical protein
MPEPERAGPEPLTETDSRFPSGPWKGFFLQAGYVGRQWMDLNLTFAEGTIRGDGRDWVGAFLIRGRYDVESGKCHWTKRYVGKHDIAYQGFNEGKGIWGTWEWTPMPSHRGGFHIWPLAMGDPTVSRLAEEADEPETVEAKETALAEVP